MELLRKLVISVLFFIVLFFVFTPNPLNAQRNFLSLDVGNKYIYCINYERSLIANDSSGNVLNLSFGGGWVPGHTYLTSTVKFNPFQKAPRWILEGGLGHVFEGNPHTRSFQDSALLANPIYFNQIHYKPVYRPVLFLGIAYRILNRSRFQLSICLSGFLIWDRKYYNEWYAIPWGGINLSFGL
ncbi:MAG: hypothetical protein K1X56_08825 [Flavobacteriales bacterium]|nr:hypothetical protein [Flavobacteriales bacterium]